TRSPAASPPCASSITACSATSPSRARAARDSADPRRTFISIALTRGLNNKFLAEYRGTSVAMIEGDYGRFLPSAIERQLQLLVEPTAATRRPQRCFGADRQPSESGLTICAGPRPFVGIRRPRPFRVGTSSWNGCANWTFSGAAKQRSRGKAISDVGRRTIGLRTDSQG